MIARLRADAAKSLAAFNEAAANPNIRNVVITGTAFFSSRWALNVSLYVFAYEVGGAAAVGLIGVIQMLPSVLAVPIITGMGDRFRRQRVLAFVYAGGALAAASLAFVLQDTDNGVAVFILAGVSATIGAAARPVQMALLPACAKRPGELIAANVVCGASDGIGAIFGPAVAAVILTVAGPEAVAVVVAITRASAALFVMRVEVAQTVAPLAERSWRDPAAVLGAALDGVRALGGLPGPRLLIAMLSVRTFVRGMLIVLLVEAAIAALGMGEPGVGTLNAAIGIGSLIGGVFALGLVGSARLAPSLALGLIGRGLPILLIGIFMDPVAAILLLAVCGVSNSIVDTSAFTLLQGTVPDRVRAGVLGVLEAAIGLTVAAGEVSAPILLDRVGVETTFIIAGAILPLATIGLWPWLRRLDDQLIVPREELRLLQGVPMFEPLSLAVLERLAGGLEQVTYPTGTPIIRQGDPGDAFYLLIHGRVHIDRDGAHVVDLGAGDSFGEVALISGEPRNATVTAAGDCRAYRLQCAAFLSAVTGNPYSQAAADRVAAERG
ncbi:MAG TPA: MFS transporter [Candidatus Limnocylindria bacterium]|nr:MFS transporter [Candidatus Limnocylindria bacterium]